MFREVKIESFVNRIESLVNLLVDSRNLLAFDFDRDRTLNGVRLCLNGRCYYRLYIYFSKLVCISSFQKEKKVYE